MSRHTGDHYESATADWLQQQGLAIRCRNYRSPWGEIDIIAQDAQSLLFIEVKYRQRSGFSPAQAAVTPAKQRKISMTAQHYLQQQAGAEPAARFDVIAVSELNNTIHFHWIKDAFPVWQEN